MSMLLEFAKQVQDSVKENKNIEIDNGHYSLLKELADVMLDFPEKPSDFSVNVVKKQLYKKVILVSGGADSTVMYELNRESDSVLCLYVDLGHSYVDKELNALNVMNIPHHVIHYPLQFDNFWKHIIPTRNFSLIALAEQFVEHEGEIWLGAVQGESSPDGGDKSELFFRMVESFIWRTQRKIVTIKTLKDKTKNDWLKWYIDKTGNMDILNTITCFDGTTSKPCGKCQACVRKWISLQYCGINQATINNMFEINPYIGGSEFIQKYKIKMQDALDSGDFTHYSHDRCKQDLSVILEYEKEQR